MPILRDFLKAMIFVFSIGSGDDICTKMGRIAGFAVEMTLRGTYGGIFAELGNPHQTRVLSYQR